MMGNVEKTTKEDKHKQDKGQFRYNTPYGYGVLDNFGAHLVGRLLTFELVNNKMVSGKLKGYGQFDIMVTDSRTGQDLIIMKHAIVSVQGDLSVKLNKWKEENDKWHDEFEKKKDVAIKRLRGQEDDKGK